MPDYHQMLLDLRGEHERIGEAILVIERLAVKGAPRRGRPPKWMSAIKRSDPQTSAPRKRKAFSAATRKKMAESQKARWAATKAA